MRGRKVEETGEGRSGLREREETGGGQGNKGWEREGDRRGEVLTLKPPSCVYYLSPPSLCSI